MSSPIDEQLLCSECFTDIGLRLEAEKLGYQDSTKCKNCGSGLGRKLNTDLVEALLTEFFLNGSLFRAEFGGANRLASNPQRFGENEVNFPSWLEKDARLIERTLQVGIFHHGPQLWRLGQIEPLDNLRRKSSRAKAVEDIISRFPSRALSKSAKFYRVRKNLTPGKELDPLEYDSPPKKLISNGRLNSRRVSVLYGSEDLEICIHECRVLIPDECFVATMKATSDLHLLDLCGEAHEFGTPFESLNFAMHFLFAAESHSYPITRAIAEAAVAKGFDGIWYPSYFSLVKENSISNIGLFGHPVKDKRIQIECINRARLKSATYEVRMGPLFN